MKNWIVLILAIFLLFGCVNPPQPPANATSPPPVMTAANNTTLVNATANTSLTLKPIPPGDSVSLDDTVWADYTLRVDGKVLDTTNATLANQSGIYNPARTYAPLKFEVAYNKSIITGFINDVIGMKVNETESFEVDPARGYGLYDPSKVIVVDRYYEKNLSEQVPRAYLESNGVNVTQGAGFQQASGMVFIQNVTNDTVTLFYVLTTGKNFTANGIPQSVVKVSNLTATIEFALDVNRSYLLPDPATGQTKVFTVLGKTDTNITLDGNHPLANKTLDFTVTVVQAERPS
jgi:FKBP-type peptidyl-prolyl cis-trans isomerase 2